MIASIIVTLELLSILKSIVRHFVDTDFLLQTVHIYTQAYVLDFNIYVYNVTSDELVTITTDGLQDVIYNGIPDWIYEGTVHCTV